MSQELNPADVEALGRQAAKSRATQEKIINAVIGLIKEKDGLRIYGSGIVSSKSESIHCLESKAPNRIGFDLERIMRTRYRIDTFQKTYFVIDSYEQLMEATAPDFAPIYEKLAALPSFPAGSVQAGDQVFNRGTGEGWLDDGDV